MNVLLICQCSGKALANSRRILDQFAERRGTRTWQTPITQQGLDVLRRLLKKSARRNTAVACHWIRGRNRSELLWIVGNARRFNSEGAVPTNTTARDVLRSDDENDWRTAEVIRLLAKLAGLFHDLGKSSTAFQCKLKRKSGKPMRDAFRHEWVSLRLFHAFIDGDDDSAWVHKLATLEPQKKPVWLKKMAQHDLAGLANSPFKEFGPLGGIIGWLIVSHHFLPTSSSRGAQQAERIKQLPRPISAAWNRADPDADLKQKKACWRFEATPFMSNSWCAEVRRVAQRLQKHRDVLGRSWLQDRYVAHLSRLCLMLADHHYSSRASDPTLGDRKFSLYANTDENGLKQRLDEHLLGVGIYAGSVARHLPRLVREMPRIARHKGFTRRSADRRFAWQDKAHDLACSLRQRTATHGFFGVNMASTGCGKTLANGRILYALADPQRGARFSIALGLRTLTLQTGAAYQQRLKLGSDDLAIQVGGGVKALFEYAQQAKAEHFHERAAPWELHGSESMQSLLDAESYVHFEGSLPEGPLKRWLNNSPDAQKLINAPVLVSTIDHLMPATEGTRGGRQIAPMLRLMSSDLVLDEADDFDIGDLPALARLVNWAGLLGSRVVVSSATLPPALVRGLFHAYLKGREAYQNNRGVPGTRLNVCCAWFDERRASAGDYADPASFETAHNAFAERRLKRLETLEPRRRARIEPLDISCGQSQEPVRQAFAEALGPLIEAMHTQQRNVDPKTGKRVSFGLIRMANIDRLIDVAQHLFKQNGKADQRLHLCCYHSHHPLLVRAAIERCLDVCLDRRRENAVFDSPDVRPELDRHSEPEQMFIVLATPVAEVGRDHDYDWAIVEPSSMRSIIQLAGRVMRHRKTACESPNVVLLNKNLKALENPGAIAFTRPGFENEQWRLNSHSLRDILLPRQYQVINAAPRIMAAMPLNAANNLVDLEHARLEAMMFGSEHDQTWASTMWTESAIHLSGIAQTLQPFRSQRPQMRYVLLPDEDLERTSFYRIERDGTTTDVTRDLLHPLDLELTGRVQPWAVASYLAELQRLSDALDLSPEVCARKFGFVELGDQDQGWSYHEVLGFRRHLT